MEKLETSKVKYFFSFCNTFCFSFCFLTFPQNKIYMTRIKKLNALYD